MVFLFLAEPHVSALPYSSSKKRSTWKGQLFETMGQIFVFVLMKIKLYHRAALSHFAELKLEMFENGYSKYHKEDFANKACGRCQTHIWWQTLYITSSLCCWKSPFTTTLPNVCLQSHRQGINSSSPAKSNTHFHCQTQIFHCHTHKHGHIVYSDTIDTDGYSQ